MSEPGRVANQTFETARAKCLAAEASGSLGKPFTEPWFDPSLWRFDEGGVLHGTLPEGLSPEGYHQIVHGGAIAALLDAAMTHCLFGRGVMGLTAEMQVRYRRPLPVGRETRVRASFETSIGNQVYRLIATVSADGEVKAEARGTFFCPPAGPVPGKTHSVSV